MTSHNSIHHGEQGCCMRRLNMIHALQPITCQSGTTECVSWEFLSGLCNQVQCRDSGFFIQGWHVIRMIVLQYKPLGSVKAFSKPTGTRIVLVTLYWQLFTINKPSPSHCTLALSPCIRVDYISGICHSRILIHMLLALDAELEYRHCNAYSHPFPSSEH